MLTGLSCGSEPPPASLPLICAAILMQAGLAALAQRYRQDFSSLEQVFDYVMQSLSQYRCVHLFAQMRPPPNLAASLPLGRLMYVYDRS